MASYTPKALQVSKGGDTYNYDLGNIHFGACSTAASTQTKTVTISEIESLTIGLCVRVKFANAQNYNGQPKLQINSLTATNIVYQGTSAARFYEWDAGAVIDFVYDGTNFVIVSGGTATTAYYGSRIKLSSATNSTAEDVAATPKAVKFAYDLADGKVSCTPANVKSALGTGSGTSKYLREDGTWQTPPDNNTTYSSKAAASGGTDVSLVTTGEKYTWNSKTSNTGTVTKVSTGAGLTGGDVTTTGTVKADLTSETKLTNAAADGTETSGRVYPVRLDKNGKLAVNVPWSDTNTNTWRGIQDNLTSTSTTDSLSANQGRLLRNAISKADESIAIVCDNSTHMALSAGQYVYVKNHASITEGLYTANSAKGANVALTTSDVTAVSNGGLNSLNSKITNMFKPVTGTITLSANQGGYIDVDVPNVSGMAPVYVVACGTNHIDSWITQAYLISNNTKVRIGLISSYGQSVTGTVLIVYK